MTAQLLTYLLPNGKWKCAKAGYKTDGHLIVSKMKPNLICQKLSLNLNNSLSSMGDELKVIMYSANAVHH